MSYSIFAKKVRIGDKVLYPDTELLIKECGITVIIGKNGCGKTTLLNQILYTNPDSVLLIAQDNDLIFDNKSIEENINIFNSDSDKLIKILKELDMEYLLSRRPHQLSGGEKRIISLLRLYYVDKDIVILDEPTNDLDYRSVDVIKSIIKDIAKEKSVLIVTHDNRIVEMADKKYNFSGGEITADILSGEIINTIPKKKTKESIKKTLSRDVVGLLLFVLVILAIIGSELSYFLFRPEQLEDIIEGQTNLATKQYGNINTMIKQGYLPLSIYLAYEGSVDMDFLNYYRDEINNAMMSGGASNMFVDNSIGEHVYLGLFWDPETDKKTYPLRDYQLLCSLTKGASIDYSEILSISDGVTEIADIIADGSTDAIDDELYRSLEEAYYSVYQNLQPRLYIILNANKDILKNENENWFVKNNETMSICNQINSLIGLKNFIVTTALCVISSIGFYILYFCISLKLLRKQIIVFRNLGIPSENVMNEMFSVRCNPKEKIILLAPYLLINLFLFFTQNGTLIFGIMVVFGVVLYLLLMLLSRKMLSGSIHTIYSFRGLYEDRY